MLNFNRLWKKSDSYAVKSYLFLPVFFLLVAVCGLVKQACFRIANAFFGESVSGASQRLDLDEDKKNTPLGD